MALLISQIAGGVSHHDPVPGQRPKNAEPAGCGADQRISHLPPVQATVWVTVVLSWRSMSWV
jgi:hypothetical protein